MPMRWKLVGLAGLAGVAATGVVLARRRRAQREYQPDELRERLHQRLAEVSTRREPEQQIQPPRPGTTFASRLLRRRA
jgi:hypothetical protein